MPDKYLCEIVCAEQLCEGVFAVTIVDERLAFEARAGQFLHINCGHPRPLRRPISICSVRGSSIEFVFEVRGEGTRWLSKKETGETLDILAPLGKGFSFPEGKIAVVGGGIGVPPMLFAAESAKSGVTAVLGFQDKGKVMLKSDFESVCDTVHITTDDGSFGTHGFVTVPLLELLETGEYKAVLACGPREMLRAVSLQCKARNISCQVSLEEKMGCGVGACLVCACATVTDGVEEMSRVCLDGPVFDAYSIDWNV